jgi:hypothetical protein
MHRVVALKMMMMKTKTTMMQRSSMVEREVQIIE